MKPVLHSVGDGEPPKGFEKRSGLVGVSFSKGLSEEFLVGDGLDSPWGSQASPDH